VAGGVFAIGALVVLTLFVLLPAVASATPNWQPPPSTTYNITPELVANGGQNNDCSFFYPGSTVNPDGTVTIPGGQVLHQFYINNPKNTTSATDPATGATFSVTVNTKTNMLTSFGSTGAAIVDVGIKGGVNTTHYNYSGFIPQPATYTGPFPGTVTMDTSLHPPISGTDKQGNTTYYTVSHTSFCYTTGSTASGLVFTDVNHNGSYESGTDTPLANATVNAYKSGSSSPVSTSSNSSGGFAFSNLVPGTTYTICAVKPASSVETLPTNALCSGTGEASGGYSISTSTTVSGLNFGFAQQATISGRAYIDPNGNGTNTSAFGGLIVTLYKGDGTTSLGTATTSSSDGSYSFANQYAGDSYRVCIASPGTSYSQTVPSTGVSCTTQGTRGYSISSLSAGGSSSNDFGFEPLGSLSGIVYQDVNGPKLGGADGAYESGTDTPLGNWTVKLYTGGNLVDTTTTSNASDSTKGSYSFTELFTANQQYTVCATPPSGTWGQSEPLPTSADVCTGTNELPKGQQFTPSTGSATVTKNFGVDPSVAEPIPCPPQTPFGSDQTGGELQIQLATCKPNQTFVFQTGTIGTDDSWASVFAADQSGSTRNPEVPLVEKWVFTDPLNADGTPKYTHVAYTDVFPYDPSAAKPLPMCKLDPRDPSDPNGMTLSSNLGGVDYTQDANKVRVLPGSDTSCAISTKIYVDAQGVTRIEVFAYSDIDSWGKLG
jgi:hypothetical protein